jgi:hypothetical protein
MGDSGFEERVSMTREMAGAADPDQPARPGPADPAARPQDPVPPGGMTHLRGLLDELRSTQSSLLTALERIRHDVQEGAPLADNDLDGLERWQAALSDAALELDHRPAEFSLSLLDEALAAAARPQLADPMDAELRRMIGEIAGAGSGRAAAPVLAALAEQARNADPAGMTQHTKVAFRALYRLMRTSRHAADPQDAETVWAAFGLPVLLVAAGAGPTTVRGWRWRRGRDRGARR